MKKLFFAFMTGFIPALFSPFGINAQTKHLKIIFNQEEVTNSSKDSTIVNNNVNELKGIHTRAVKGFATDYGNVKNAQWHTLADGFAVCFTEQGIRNTVYYNRKGKWAGILKGYTESNLDRGIRKLVKQTYYDHDITYVHEVKTPDTNDHVVYIVQLQDAKSILLVRVCDGITDVWQEYKKQN